MLLSFSYKLWHVEGKRIYDVEASKLDPHRPSQKVSEQQAMFANVEYCFDPVQARENHWHDKTLNKYRLAVILQAAGVDSIGDTVVSASI